MVAKIQTFVTKGGLQAEGGGLVAAGPLIANTSGAITAFINTASGWSLSVNDLIVTDVSTTATGYAVANYIGQSTLISTATITTAVNFWVAGPPIATTGTIISNSWAAYINTGNVFIGEPSGNPNGFTGNALQVVGGIAASGGIYVTGGGTMEGVYFLNGSPILTAATQNTGTQFFNAQVVIDTTANSYSTTTGALVIGRSGGAGIAGNVYVGGYLAVLTTATIQGTTPSVSTNTGALTIGGGLGVGGAIYATSENISGNINAGTINITSTSSTALNVTGGANIGTYLEAQDLVLLDSSSATGYLAAPLTVTGGAYIGANLIIGSTATNSFDFAGGGMIMGDLKVYGHVIIDTDINVANTSYITGAQILTSGTIAQFAVTTLTAGTDTQVNTSTGPITVWNTSTLDTVSGRGATTTNAINILNTLTVSSLLVTGNEINSGTVSITNATQAVSSITGALTVAGGVGIQGSLYAYEASYISGSQILTTSTIGSYGVSAISAGTDTAVSTSTGEVTVWNTSTLDSVTHRGNITTSTIIIANASSSTNTSTGALVVEGGVAIQGSLFLENTANIGGDLNSLGNLNIGESASIASTMTVGGSVSINNTSNSTSTNTGALLVAGGLGIGGNLYVGGTLINTQNLTVDQNFSTYGTIDVFNTSASTSTSTGAVVISGGLGVGGAINAGETSTINGSVILTTSTIGSYGVSSLIAGTDTAINTSTGPVTIWNTSTLDTVAQRGNTTTATITIENTLTVTIDVLIENNLTVNNQSTFAGVTATGLVSLQNIEDSISTTTGAVQIAGGLGVRGNIYATAMYDQNARVITTATIGEFAVSSLTAGTDTAVSTSTGAVIVWNTSTLQTVTDRGNSTNNSVNINNEGTQALYVAGGTNLNNTLIVGSTATFNDVEIYGVTTVNNDTNSTSTTTGAVVIDGGLGVQGNIYASAMYDQNARVVTTATIGNYGVSSLTAGTDTSVNTSTGNIIIWNTSTLDTVAHRGNSTTATISINNFLDSTGTNTGALTVAGGVGIGGNLWVQENIYTNNSIFVNNSATIGGSVSISGSATIATFANIADTSYIAGAEIVTTSTIFEHSVATLTAGTDTAVNTSTGFVTVWNTSTLQTVTGRGASTNQAISITNSTSATTTNTGALTVVGGAGFGGNIVVGGFAYIKGDLFVDGSQTIVNSNQISTGDKTIGLSTETTSTTLAGGSGLIVGTGTGFINWLYDGVDNWTSNGGINIAGTATITQTTNSTSTTTGALIVEGGVGVNRDVYIGGNLYVQTGGYINNFQIVTTGTIGSYGVTTLTAGTDTAVNTNTGRVIVWNTSTLDTVISRGNSTTGTINILNSSSLALQVSGGISATSIYAVSEEVGSLLVDTNATVTNTLSAGQVFDNDNRVITNIYPVAGQSIGITNVTSTGPTSTFTVINLGVTATIAGDFIGVSTSTGSVIITNLGVQQAQGSEFISVTTSTGTVQIINNGVTYLEGSSAIGVTTSTGTVTIINLGVTEIIAGADISVSENTGTVVVSNTSTLETVTSRGNTTDNEIIITNLSASSNSTSGALQVAGGVGIGGTLNVAQNIYAETALVITTATIAEFAVTSLTVGTDTAITTSTGAAVLWSTATLQSITGRNSTTTNFVNFANTTQSTSTTTGAVVIDGGLGLGGNLWIGGTLIYSEVLDILSTVQSTSTTTGAILTPGGVGIGENLNVGGTLTVWNTTNSTSTTTGALMVDGGIGAQGDIWANNIYSYGSLVYTAETFKGVNSITAGTDTAINTSTGAVTIWNTSTLDSVISRGNSTTGTINILNSSSLALQIAGGLTVNGATNLQNLFVNNTIQSVNGNLYINTGTTGSVYLNGINILNYSTATWFVSLDGNDNNDGRRPQSAFASVAKALSVATTGTEVYVDAGTYTETWPLVVPKGVTLRGAGLRATIIQPTSVTNTQTGLLLNGEVLVSDLTLTGFYKPGYGIAFNNPCVITTKSPYLERVSVITRGSIQTASDPYGYNQGDAGNGVYLNGDVIASGSLEPAMLFNEVTFIVPNATGMYMTNGVRAELLNGFFYFANKAVDAESNVQGLYGAGQTRLKLTGISSTASFKSTDVIYLKDPLGNILASGNVASTSGSYVYISGPAWGFYTPTNRTAEIVTAYGSANLSTIVYKFGTSSLSVTTASDYVEVLSDATLQFNTDYTIEGWVQPKSGSAVQRTIFNKSNGTDGVLMYLDGSNRVNARHGTSLITGVTPLSTATWYHVAMVRNTATSALSLYLNGNLEANAPNGVTSSASNFQPLDIGSDQIDGFNGYIDDFRISNIVRYSNSFTPSTTGLLSDSATQLMLHFEGTNGSQTILDDNITTQNIVSGPGQSGASAEVIALADYHQFGAELRCIGSAAVFGNQGVIANGTGTDLKLIAFNMSFIGAGGDLSDDDTLTIQTNEVIQLNGGKVYYQTVDQEGNFRVGNSFLVDQNTGNVTFNTSTVNLSNISSLYLANGSLVTNITPGNIIVANLNLGGNTLGSLTGDINISPAGSLTTINSNLQVDGNLNVSQTSFINGSQILTTSTIGSFGVTTISGGTDTSVSTSTGGIVIWDTSTLQSVTGRGNSTTASIKILNTTSSLSSITGALTVAGGVGIGGVLNVWNNGGVGNAGFVSTIQSTDGYGALILQDDSTGVAQLSIRGYTSSTYRLDIGYHTFSDFAYIQSYHYGSTYQPLWLQWNGGDVVLGNSTDNHQARIIYNVDSTSTTSGALVVSGGVGIGASLNVNGLATFNTLTSLTATINQLYVTGGVQSTGTTTGALIITNSGGVGVGGNLYASALYDQGSRVITQASLGSQGVTAIYAGTDTAVSSQTGIVYVWNTSTLQSVTGRGNSTTNPILILNTSTSTSVGTGALQVSGGLSVGDNLNMVGDISAAGKTHIFGGTVPFTVAGNTPVLGIANSTSATYQLMLSNVGNLDALAFGLNNMGAGSIGTFGVDNGGLSLWAANPEVINLYLAPLTGQVQVPTYIASTSTSSGSLVVAGGIGIGGAIYAVNTSYVSGAQIITTGTISQFAVTDLQTGPDINGNDDISITTSVGVVTLVNESTLQTVTKRGSVTNVPITLTNGTQSISTTTGALVIDGGLGVAGNGYFGGNLYVQGSAVITQGTLGENGVTQIVGGVDINVTTGTGVVTINNTSTLQTVTGRGNSTTNSILILNTTSSTGTTTGALLVTGGVAVGNNLYVQGTVSAAGGFLGLNPASIYENTSSVTVIDTGSTREIIVTVASLTNTVFLINETDFYQPVKIKNTATTFSTGTNSGALIVSGGVWIASTSYINGSQIITTATIATYGVNNIIGGTDTAVLTSGTTIYIWSTATLQSLTNRSSTTSNAINITNGTNGGIGQGALTVAGGGYFGEDLYVGGQAVITGNLTVLGTQTTIFSTSSMSISDPVINLGSPENLGPLSTDDGLDKGILVHYNTLTNSSGDTHAFFGMQRSTEKFVYITRTQEIGTIGQSNPFTGYTLGGALFGSIILNSGIQSTSPYNGDVVTSGGIGIGGNLNVGTSATVAGTLSITNTTSATNSLTGALTVAGGVGIQGNLYVGGFAAFVGGAQIITTATLGSGGTGVVNINAGTDTAVSTASGVVTIWNTSTLASITSRGNSTTSTIAILNTTSSTGTTGGALVVSGDVGIGGSIWIGGNLNLTGNEFDSSGLSVAGLVRFTNQTSSTGTNSGALVVTGGLGVGGTQYIGGILNVASNTNITGTLNVTNTTTLSSVMIGSGATPRSGQAKQVFSNGNFASAGDAQAGVYVLRTAVTAGTSYLTCDNLSVNPYNQVNLPANSTFNFTINVTARSTNSQDEAGWQFTGVITQYANAGTTVLRVVNKTKLYSSQSTFDCNVSADTVNGAIAILGSSSGSQSMRFVAKVETVEVTN